MRSTKDIGEELAALRLQRALFRVQDRLYQKAVADGMTPGTALTPNIEEVIADLEKEMAERTGQHHAMTKVVE